MKLRLTSLLLLVAFGVSAQKQLPSYTYTLSNNEGKTETILISASADAVNSITFTLKNEKNEPLKTKKDNKEVDITFKVFPFTEVSFRKYLVDAIASIDEKEESNEKYDVFKTTLAPLQKVENASQGKKLGDQLNERNKAVQEVRNIYQFFNALVITAFEYDDEPVAGILKYNEEALIIKQSIDGLNTDDYFNRQAKLLRKLILDADNDPSKFETAFNNKNGKYKNIKIDDFLKFLAGGIDSKANRNKKNDNYNNRNRKNSLTPLIDKLILKLENRELENVSNEIDSLVEIKKSINILEENIQKSKEKLCESDPNCEKGVVSNLKYLKVLSDKLTTPFSQFGSLSQSFSLLF
ncbi:MAG: hypothetical protein AAF611_06275 [Bacteroidota bacterium]